MRSLEYVLFLGVLLFSDVFLANWYGGVLNGAFADVDAALSVAARAAN